MSDKEKSHKIVGVRLTKVMCEELEELAKTQQRSVSNVIRMALEEHLNKFFKENK